MSNEEVTRTGSAWTVRLFQVADAQACCWVINAAITEMDGLNEAARSHIIAHNTPELLGADLRSWRSLVVETASPRLVAVGALDGSEIKRVYVDPAAQGLGVGGALLEAIEAEAANAGLSAVQLDASPSSVDFYTSRGYEVQSEGGFTIGAAEFTFVTMTKTL